jgi:hypothetical protein
MAVANPTPSTMATGIDIETDAATGIADPGPMRAARSEFCIPGYPSSSRRTSGDSPKIFGCPPRTS